MTMSFIDPLLRIPQIEVVARAYLLGPMAPIPVMTRLPNPDKTADTINGALRIEAGGGSKPNRFHWDVQLLLHGYSPDEDQANGIAADAVSLMSSARGQTVQGWYVVDTLNVGAPQRRDDPDVNLPRYMGTVTWRVAGQPWTPP
jgi:hypothetical protein